MILHKGGRDVLGLDISANLLKIAKQGMRREGIRFSLVRAEMQHLPLRTGTISTVINMFTSFGYLPSKKEDMLSLKEVARTLKQSGLLLLDVVNRERLEATFKNKDWGEFPNFYMLERRTLDIEKSKLYSQWTLIDKKDGKIKTFDHNLRLYTLPQLQEILEKAGLTMVGTFGNYEGQELQQDSHRLIVLARR